MLCKDTLSTFLLVAKISTSSLFKPILMSPLMMPIVAATDPLSSTALIESLATLTFAG